jgi:hypothetical protein
MDNPKPIRRESGMPIEDRILERDKATFDDESVHESKDTAVDREASADVDA